MRHQTWTLARLRLLFTAIFVVSVVLMWSTSSNSLGGRQDASLRLHSVTQPAQTIDQGTHDNKRLVLVTRTHPVVTEATTVQPTTPVPPPTTTNQPPLVFFARIIGNALPPRHDPQRTLINLRFILENEFQDPRVQKHWVLNRILDPAVENAIVELLEEFQVSYSRISFVLGEYAKTQFDLFDQDDGHDQIHSNATLDAWNKNLVLSSMYDAKNLYAMSINHARNRMIELGIERGARWILPWDENCFLTEKGWKKIAKSLTSHSSNKHKYFVTWMDRLKEENDVVLAPSYKPNAWEEPQIIFRNDAIERFDAALRYGRRDKAALLVRLKVPGVWHEWGWSKWERQRTFDNISTDITEAVPATSFVIRLYSGKALFEDQAYGFHREMARADAVALRLEALDDRVMREILHYSPRQLCLYNLDKILALKDRTVDANLLDTISQSAEVILKQHDGSEGEKPRGIPVKELRNRFESMVYDALLLFLGFIATKNDRFEQQSLILLHEWFIDTNKSIKPVPGFDVTDRNSILSTDSIAPLCDLLVLLEQFTSNKAYTSGVLLHINKWLIEFYKTLERDSKDISQWFRSTNEPDIGLSYDKQMARLAAYLDHPTTYRFFADTVQARLTSQPPNSVDALRAWIDMARISDAAGISVWKFQDSMLCQHASTALFISCCDPSKPTCKVKTIAQVLENGWDLLAVVEAKCESVISLPAECVAAKVYASSQAAKISSLVKQTTTQYRSLPFPSLLRD